MMWRAISTGPVARHVIDSHFEPSYLELKGILRRGERYLPGPIVGCGQTYTDLRKLNVKSIVKILLSN